MGYAAHLNAAPQWRGGSHVRSPTPEPALVPPPNVDRRMPLWSLAGSIRITVLRDHGQRRSTVATRRSKHGPGRSQGKQCAPGVQYRDRVFSPVTTNWGFLGQVLSEDHSCRDTVSRIIAHRAANGNTVCSSNTASYCNARSRILTSILSTLAKRTAEELQTSIADQWKWNGRLVYIVDGSHVSMPDTAKNQAAYPQPPTQEPGLGFPLAKITVALSLAMSHSPAVFIASPSRKLDLASRRGSRDRRVELLHPSAHRRLS